MIELITNALLAGIGISLIAGPIGSLMVWQRMSYFGDTLAHSALLGICIAVIMNINIYYGLIITCLAIAIILTLLSKHQKFTNDTTLSILSHSIFAAGLIAATLQNNSNLDLLSYLCGDILSVTKQDLIYLVCIDLIVIISLFILWEKLIFITISRELAIANGIPEQGIRWIFILLVSLVFAVSIRLVGVLLINALLIIPCTTAKLWAKGPTQMAITGSLYSCLSIFIGIIGSFVWDIPTGPTIVLGATFLFIINLLMSMLKYK